MVMRIVAQRHGGPEVLQPEDAEIGAPGRGEIRVRHTAIGLNYIDTYHRTGLYPTNPPFTPGLEAAGVVEAVGKGVTGLKEGQRVAYGTGPMGAYAEARLMPADKAIAIPDGIDDRTAAAMMLKGMTVRYLICETYKVQKGDTVLWHAAAGGVGLIACQWLKHLGVRVIGTAGSAEKADLAKRHGCDEAILYKEEDVAKRVRDLTGGEGVPVVYDGVGKATLAASLDSLRPRGLFVSFGNASGPIKDFDLGLLSAKGSLYVTRPTVMTYTATRAGLEANAADLIEVVRGGAVTIPVNQTFALKDARKAHEALEGRETTGATLLLP
ncbi:MAG: quinone oxidoreductase [Geminicoccaceae bacterium]|nr:quinone oxidoreductase [Geminicoccaceae bacterium]